MPRIATYVQHTHEGQADGRLLRLLWPYTLGRRLEVLKIAARALDSFGNPEMQQLNRLITTNNLSNALSVIDGVLRTLSWIPMLRGTREVFRVVADILGLLSTASQYFSLVDELMVPGEDVFVVMTDIVDEFEAAESVIYGDVPGFVYDGKSRLLMGRGVLTWEV